MESDYITPPQNHDPISSSRAGSRAARPPWTANGRVRGGGGGPFAALGQAAPFSRSKGSATRRTGRPLPALPQGGRRRSPLAQRAAVAHAEPALPE
eukprot:scaffold1009_cov375-Prasinococcus_capsulatus_cf.AAC.17